MCSPVIFNTLVCPFLLSTLGKQLGKLTIRVLKVKLKAYILIIIKSVYFTRLKLVQDILGEGNMN